MTSRFPSLLLAAIISGGLHGPAVKAADDTITPLDVARMQMVTEQAISPDGTQVAYALRVQRNPLTEENGGAWGELHVVDVNTSRSRPFITGKISLRSIAWTPDGSGISFLAKRGDDKTTCLYVIPVDGGRL